MSTFVIIVVVNSFYNTVWTNQWLLRRLFNFVYAARGIVASGEFFKNEWMLRCIPGKRHWANCFEEPALVGYEGVCTIGGSTLWREEFTRHTHRCDEYHLHLLEVFLEGGTHAKQYCRKCLERRYFRILSKRVLKCPMHALNHTIPLRMVQR